MINDSGPIKGNELRWVPRGNFQARPANPATPGPNVHEAKTMERGESYVLPRTSWQSPEAQMKEIIRARDMLDGGRNWRVRPRGLEPAPEWPPRNAPPSAAMYSAPVNPGPGGGLEWPPTSPPPSAAMYSAPVNPGPGGGLEWPPTSPPPSAAMYSAPVNPGEWPPSSPPPSAAIYSAPINIGEWPPKNPPPMAMMYGGPWMSRRDTISGN